MNSNEDCFHLGVKALIRNKEGHVLIIERPRRSGQTYWDIPGGRLQRGETALEGLRRELEEEIGLKTVDTATWLCTEVTNIRIGSPDNDVGLILSVYTMDAPFDFIPELGDGHINFLWVTNSQAIDYLKIDYPPKIICCLREISNTKSEN